MKKKIQIVWLIALCHIPSLFAQETMNVMFYNLLNFPLEDSVPNRIQYLDLILNDYQPDLFMVCELNNEDGANSILQTIQNSVDANFNMATFQLNTSDDTIGDQNDLQNLLFYNSSKFLLESQDIVTTIFRDFNHYQLKLNTVNQDSNPVFIDIIVCHLKASNSVENQEFRLEMVEDLMTYLNTIPTTNRVILAGDFNVYYSSEPAFQTIIDQTNPIVFVDPVDRVGSWHNNTDYIDVFTQSTRTQTGSGGSTGGFDDRFDFIMTSENLLSDSELFYVPNSYQVYGNNGNVNCFNRSIINSGCSGSNFSLEIRESLHNFSDHLPVTLQIETNQTLLSVPEFISNTYFEIVGTNIVQELVTFKFDNHSNFTKAFYIYNVLGQQVKTIPVNDSYTYRVPVDNLSNGIYYIAAPNENVEPLKFVKIN